MTAHDWITLVRDLGFPVVISLLFVLRLDRRLTNQEILLSQIAKSLELRAELREIQREITGRHRIYED